MFISGRHLLCCYKHSLVYLSKDEKDGPRSQSGVLDSHLLIAMIASFVSKIVFLSAKEDCINFKKREEIVVFFSIIFVEFTFSCDLISPVLTFRDHAQIDLYVIAAL